jgi:hypothetical protein
LGRGSPSANLIVTEGGTTVHNQLLTSGTGTAPLTVEYGKTYIAQLVQTFGGQPLGAPLTITTEDADAKAPCNERCIRSIDVQPHGGWAQFTIETSETAIITVEASTKPPNSDGKWSNPADVAAFAGSVLPTDHYTPPLANLAANTTYHYVVRIHVQGHELVKTGTFKTLTRRVDVTFDAIQMIDDSDGPVDGDCDCWFWFGVGDQTPKLWGQYGTPHSVASGTTVHPNVVFAVNNAPAEVRLGTVGHDDDTDPLDLFCTYDHSREIPEHPPLDWKANGDGACVEYAGNQVFESLSRQGPPANPGAVDEQFTDSFTINVTGILTFNVRGTYTVSYA